ncbi:hypothetical protein [Membranihabitans maritimus]|uniref:hypothetical protein n=1 Tax=Membranihabitans maritimus TaxID=2904244 RepID=UPI001F26BA92|nr:hypothetical protein [Membranihabitans maritimus]
MREVINLNALIVGVLVSFCGVLIDAQPLGSTNNSQLKRDHKDLSIVPVNIGSQLELFIDDFIIEDLKNGAKVKLHHPVPREIVMVHDEPWEGSGSGYHSVFKDGDLYRMYYKSWQHRNSSDLSNFHPLYCAYAESKDGVNWNKPNLSLYEFNGSKNNNIVFESGNIDGFKLDAGHPAVFKDENPNVSNESLYKAVLVGSKPNLGLVAYHSPDGINWEAMSDEQIITDGVFDSQNLAFWDPVGKVYRAYWRYFDGGDGVNPYVGNRAIRTATSKDFINWSNYADLEYVDSPDEELYTNQIKPYYRAPHILIGFPARYIDRGWSESMRVLPELDERAGRSEKSERYGTVLTETLLMSSRDGETFDRWNEAFIRPGIERKGTWTYGDAYSAWHVVETPSSIPGAPNELSMYVTENYWKGTASSLRRYTLRIDGFVSIYAPMNGGEVVTKPLVFKGDNLNINFSSSAAGEILVELLDEKGQPIPGFGLSECDPVFGDAIERTVSWKGRINVSAIAGKPVKLRFVLKDADLYSFQFK